MPNSLSHIAALFREHYNNGQHFINPSRVTLLVIRQSQKSQIVEWNQGKKSYKIKATDIMANSKFLCGWAELPWPTLGVVFPVFPTRTWLFSGTFWVIGVWLGGYRHRLHVMHVSCSGSGRYPAAESIGRGLNLSRFSKTSIWMSNKSVN